MEIEDIIASVKTNSKGGWMLWKTY